MFWNSRIFGFCMGPGLISEVRVYRDPGCLGVRVASPPLPLARTPAQPAHRKLIEKIRGMLGACAGQLRLLASETLTWERKIHHVM